MYCISYVLVAVVVVDAVTQHGASLVEGWLKLVWRLNSVQCAHLTD